MVIFGWVAGPVLRKRDGGKDLSIDVGSLRKILKLEQQKGYPDSSVIGGLDQFLHRWIGQAGGLFSVPKLPTRSGGLNLIHPGYASLNQDQRARWVEGMLTLLAELETQEERKAEPAMTPLVRRTAVNSKKKMVADGKSVDLPVTVVHGVSSGLAAKFKKLGVTTVRDLLYFFPNRHLDYSQGKHISQLTEGEEATVVVNVWQAQEVRLGGRRSTEAVVGDETGNVRVVWFNNPYLAKKLATNTRIVISGRVGLFNGRHVFESPEWEQVGDEDLVHTGRLVPVYPLTSGLHPRQVRKLMKEVVDRWVVLLEDFLPREVRERHSLLDLVQAISQAHYPDDEALKDRARLRLAFDELFLLQLGVLSKKRHWQEGQPGNPFSIDVAALDVFLKSLPFELTPAQQRVLQEIMTDLERAQPMSRLLQGEVGSGKTVVATAALLMAAANGYQGALMAPTEILAEQHFTTIRKLLSGVSGEEKQEENFLRYSGRFTRPINVALLIGDINLKKKEKLKQRVASGEVDIAIGTHALIQKGVAFSRLGLVVIDEQHRFGVAQRSAIRQKGFNPHVLVMTATPIPRTLALTLYGDLDLSVIDQLPPGRQVIKTKWLKPEQRNSAYNFLCRQVAGGRQAFILCPLVEESEAVQAKAAIAEYEHLSRDVFPEFKLGLLHGRMTAADKDKVMRRFRSAELNILVSTPVIEVGIDVPNATVMMVESADRFGLSQLHQFRGRVGRGQEQSYCMLLAHDPSEVSRERLGIIERVQDGFALAEEDLKLRGPGEFFGTRQSGLPDLKMAKLSDVALLEMARSEAIRLFEIDPGFEKAEHHLLVKELTRVWPAEGGEWS
ncbi:MAG: ATP-dependent DNA helicase RecG [Dehalococcoidales bacterium]|nr:ATP-dependent DNA helicase RecG [Dehalococcoidales bacterium]